MLRTGILAILISNLTKRESTRQHFLCPRISPVIDRIDFGSASFLCLGNDYVIAVPRCVLMLLKAVSGWFVESRVRPKILQ